MRSDETHVEARAPDARRAAAWFVPTVVFLLAAAAGVVFAPGGPHPSSLSLGSAERVERRVGDVPYVTFGTTAQAQLWSDRVRMCEPRGSTVYVPPELLAPYVELGAAPGPCE